ncbi:hypothetical protein L3X38_030222 [Prunus dulcis]|uniref:Uncharacterized protein n=1 Tax=Prunus dulcis TaxID=3755 RepID=A0AAD4VC13_PRUDU|nr:hypothetical protein L3X38_030222 [Prunus dulcis]
MGGLRGPWMNVLARRKPKVVAADKGSKGSGNRNQGFRFDALRKVGENFGLDEGLVSGNGAQTGTAKPPSIDASGNEHEEECDTDIDIDTTSLVSSAYGGGLPQEHMDMSEGHKIFSQEKTTSHAFNNVESMTIGS